MALKELLLSNTAASAHGSVKSLATSLGMKSPVSLRHLLMRGARELVLREHRIKHIFVLMLENRSFDHVFGLSQLAGIDPLGQPRHAESVPVPLPTNNDWVTSNAVPTTKSVGNLAKFNLIDKDGDPPHDFNDVLLQLCGQAAFQAQPTDDDGNVLLDSGYPPIDNSGFVASYHRPGSNVLDPGLVMQCFQPVKLPVLHALAKQFAVCDNWFASMPGPTWPNRFFAHAASAGGLDDSPSSLDILVATTLDGYGFENGTIYDLLDDKDVDWVVFEGDEFPQVFAISGMNLNALAGNYVDFDEFETEISDPEFKAGYIFIEPAYKVFNEYVCGTSMHPRDDVTRGERLIKKVYETLRASQLWEESVLLVVFDEHGGFFDHVPPPATTPPGDKPGDDDLNTHHFNFDRLGPRVPAIVVSPWVPANLVDHAQYEHASVPATVEALFGLSHLTQRDAHANDFLHLLSLHAPRKDAPLQLPSAAVSGLDCSDEEEAQQGIVPPDKLEQVDLSRGSTMGFLQIAVRRHLSLVPLAERSGVMQRVGAIHTIADARDYMREVKGIVQARRVAGRTVPPSP